VAGTLHVVATPLGNLDDLSPRARRILAGVALIACEDTRRTSKLLARFGIEVPTIALHKFSEAARLAAVVEALAAGRDVALVSDGGTPGISDPGARLVAAAHAAAIRVSPVPGPSAVVALLSASGLPADRFVFEGFLPARAGQRRKRLAELAAEPRTWVVHEAPHRVRETLGDMADALHDRTIVLGREMTKVHETLLRGTAAEVRRALGDGDVRGEIAIAVAGFDGTAVRPKAEDPLEVAWSAALGEAGGDVREALKRASKALSLGRSELWRRLTERGLA